MDNFAVSNILVILINPEAVESIVFRLHHLREPCLLTMISVMNVEHESLA